MAENIGGRAYSADTSRQAPADSTYYQQSIDTTIVGTPSKSEIQSAQQYLSSFTISPQLQAMYDALKTIPTAAMKDLQQVKFEPDSLKISDVNSWRNHIGEDRFNAYREFYNAAYQNYILNDPPSSPIQGGIRLDFNYLFGSIPNRSTLFNPDQAVPKFPDSDFRKAYTATLTDEYVFENIYKPMKQAQVDAINQRYGNVIESLRNGELPEYSGDETIDFIRDLFIKSHDPKLLDVASWSKINVIKDSWAKFKKRAEVASWIGPQYSTTNVAQMLNLNVDLVEQIRNGNFLAALNGLDNEFVKAIDVPEVVKKVYQYKVIPSSEIMIAEADGVDKHWSWADFKDDFQSKMMSKIINGKRYYIPKHMSSWSDKELSDMVSLIHEGMSQDQIDSILNDKAQAKKNKNIKGLMIAGAIAAAAMMFGG